MGQINNNNEREGTKDGHDRVPKRLLELIHPEVLLGRQGKIASRNGDPARREQLRAQCAQLIANRLLESLDAA